MKRRAPRQGEKGWKPRHPRKGEEGWKPCFWFLKSDLWDVPSLIMKM